MAKVHAGAGSQWRQALKRAIAHRYGSLDKGLVVLAQGVVERAAAGDKDCWAEIGNRLDGKPAQTIGSEESPVRVVISQVQSKL